MTCGHRDWDFEMQGSINSNKTKTVPVLASWMTLLEFRCGVPGKNEEIMWDKMILGTHILAAIYTHILLWAVSLLWPPD